MTFFSLFKLYEFFSVLIRVTKSIDASRLFGGVLWHRSLLLVKQYRVEDTMSLNPNDES